MDLYGIPMDIHVILYLSIKSVVILWVSIFLYISLDISKYSWIFIGNPLIFMDTCKCHRLVRTSYISMDIHEFSWTTPDFHGYSWIWIDLMFSMDVYGHPWIFIKICRFRRIFMDIIDSYGSLRYLWISINILKKSKDFCRCLLISIDVYGYLWKSMNNYWNR